MDSDSDDDRMLAQARTSREIRNHDEQFLADEDEQDELLQQSRRQTGRTAKTNQIKDDAKDTHAGDVSSPEVEHRRLKRKERRQKKKASLTEEAMRGEDGALMYEMEEGGLKEGSTTGESSDADASFELDRQALGDAQEKKARKRNCKTWICTYLGVFVGLVVLIYIAWRLSQKRRAVKEGQAFVSNGTALFAPTTILISLDGFRADFVNRGITPNLQSFIKNGVSPLYMTPSFPSVTFPNHYTIVTGLYPESHGIVGNSFWDPAMNEEFFYTDPLAMQPKWWGGEPIWVTAEKQGIRTATHMWPGSEAHILGVEPSFVDKFNGKEKLSNKVARILELLDKPGMEDPDASPKDMRPQFIASYVPNVDSMGHLYGPNSTEVVSTISQVDEMLGQLFTGLQDRNLSSIVNIIVVSDHGMATSDIQRLIQLDDILDMSLIDKTDGWPLFGLRPRDPATVQEIYDHLVTASRTHRGFDVYLRDHNMPERYHFSRNQRIAPLWLVPKTGWAIVTRSDFDVEQAKISGEVYHPIGIHGYDDEHPLMRAIFVARGPAFPHEPNSRVETFSESSDPDDDQIFYP